MRLSTKVKIRNSQKDKPINILKLAAEIEKLELALVKGIDALSMIFDGQEHPELEFGCYLDDMIKTLEGKK